MATTKTQRIFISVITIVMVVGAIGSFAVMVMGQENQSREEARIQKIYQDYLDKVKAQNKELSAKYFDRINQFADKVGPFEKTSITELNSLDLLEGDGEVVTGETSFSAYYIGWTPNGKIFDQSIDTSSNSLNTPIAIEGGLDKAGLIEGWKKGMIGMKIGGVRLIEIPSDLAYGETGKGDDIPPNTPLKFIVLAIPTPKQIEIPKELLNAN